MAACACKRILSKICDMSPHADCCGGVLSLSSTTDAALGGPCHRSAALAFQSLLDPQQIRTTAHYGDAVFRLPMLPGRESWRSLRRVLVRGDAEMIEPGQAWIATQCEYRSIPTICSRRGAHQRFLACRFLV
jgi:hypothetical protein